MDDTLRQAILDVRTKAAASRTLELDSPLWEAIARLCKLIEPETPEAVAHLSYLNMAGKRIATAVAATCRLTPTLIVIEAKDVTIVGDNPRKVQFNGRHTFKRDTLACHPKTNPYALGRWVLDKVRT